jgi:hypothetical protein
MSDHAQTELSLHEERAQHGIIEFAEEMQVIRDQNLYPGAKHEPDAWKTYCNERWGMSDSTVRKTIQALPVLQRLSRNRVPADAMPSVSAATSVAALPEPVQDAILAESPKRNDASDKAKAVRKAKDKIEKTEGREATVEELVEVAKAPVSKPKKAKPKMKASKFVSNLAQAHWHLEQAANIAHSEPIDDVENDYGFAMISKFNYEIERLREKLYQPEIVKDADEAFAELLGGEER